MKQRLVDQHYQFLLQLETNYMNDIQNALQKKTSILFRIYHHLVEQMERIDNLERMALMTAIWSQSNQANVSLEPRVRAQSPDDLRSINQQNAHSVHAPITRSDPTETTKKWKCPH